MKDINTPWMTFIFIFFDSALLGYEFFKSDVNINSDDVPYLNKEGIYIDLVNAELSFNRFEQHDEDYWFGCGGIQEKSDVIGAWVKIRFNSDRFLIFDENNNELQSDKYYQICSDWWDFVNGKRKLKKISHEQL